MTYSTYFLRNSRLRISKVYKLHTLINVVYFLSNLLRLGKKEKPILIFICASFDNPFTKKKTREEKDLLKKSEGLILNAGPTGKLLIVDHPKEGHNEVFKC